MDRGREEGERGRKKRRGESVSRPRTSHARSSEWVDIWNFREVKKIFFGGRRGGRIASGGVGASLAEAVPCCSALRRKREDSSKHKL